MAAATLAARTVRSWNYIRRQQ